jgi:hypothetical protein
MSPVITTIRETHLFTYVIASADLWYNPIDERTVYLRNDPDFGPIIRGEIGGCGPDCHANLSLILLEYALSCKGCQDKDKAGNLVECAGERLGKILSTRLYQDAPEMSTEEQVSEAFQFILRSMNAPHEVERTENTLRFVLDYCPLHETAEEVGLTSGIPVAYRGFVALLESMLQALAPTWQLIKPLKQETITPLSEIILHY